jgi:hypothetical protein
MRWANDTVREPARPLSVSASQDVGDRHRLKWRGSARLRSPARELAH